MIPQVASHLAAIAALCRRFGVLRLDLFGSAAAGNFDSAHSDLDFVADFADPSPTVAYADRVLDFSSGLEALMGRRVDVVSAHAIRGSRFAQGIAGTRQPVYVEPAPVAV